MGSDPIVSTSYILWVAGWYEAYYLGTYVESFDNLDDAQSFLVTCEVKYGT